MVRRDCRIRQRDRTAAATARSRDFGELVDRQYPRARFDVRNALRGVDLDADDVWFFL
jgi:hypothetical protein